MTHYFENNTDLISNKRKLKLFINDRELYFWSDVGVFSNSKIDYGSFVFLKTLLQEDSKSTVLDVGCGYGVLGITLKIFDLCQHVDMVDINQRAVDLCNENIKYYNLNDANCFVSDGFNNVSKKYDMIVINPPIRAGKAVIYKMFEDSKNYLNTNGALYIVIKKDLGAPSAKNKLQEIYKNVEVINKNNGYWIIKSND